MEPFFPVPLLTAHSQHKLQWELRRDRDEKPSIHRILTLLSKLEAAQSSENTTTERSDDLHVTSIHDIRAVCRRHQHVEVKHNLQVVSEVGQAFCCLEIPKRKRTVWS